MGSYPVSFIETLNRSLGVPDIQRFPHQAMGGAVEMSSQFKVIIDIESDLFPLGILVVGFRQRQHGWSIELFETARAGAGQLSEGAVVQKGKTFFDSGIGLGQTEESPFAQTDRQE